MTLKIPYGEKDGHLVHIGDVPRGLACHCVCPECGGTLVARKGNTNVHHFAHLQEENCDGESLLHKLGKRLLHDRICNAISRGEDIPFRWRCCECQDTHQGNLTELASTVELEESLGSIQPDVTVFDRYRKPRVLVEVVVTHEPEAPVWDYARQNEAYLVVFKVETVHDLERLDKGTPLTPTASSIPVCTRPKCKGCYGPLRRRSLYRFEKQCTNCAHIVQQSVVKTDTPLLRFYGPEGFNSDEIALAKQEGVSLGMQPSSYFPFNYLANTCPNCGKDASRLYDYSEVAFKIAEKPPVNSEEFCVHCETRPDNRTPQSLLQGCIIWLCDEEREIGKVVCSSHLQSYFRGSLNVPFVNPT